MPAKCRKTDSPNTSSPHDIPKGPADTDGSAADRVFHILELAQQIVYELEFKNLFKAFPITKDL
ncbi:hypothetical protein FVEN_g12619 [Fusarium venenatum]|nr:hypothetical protein FVEN_g12619 [Fusarium venenatum]